MNAKERIEGQKKFEAVTGIEYKKIKWKTICLETKDFPNKPKSLITGEVDYIYPTGDIAFKKIIKLEIWNQEQGDIQECKIPDVYKSAKKIVIRREIVAAVLYLEELPEENKVELKQESTPFIYKNKKMKDEEDTEIDIPMII